MDDFEVIQLGTILKDPPLGTTTQSGPQITTSGSGSGGGN